MAAARADRFDYCKFVELDYVPMETGCMVSMRPTKGYGSRASAKGLSSSRSPEHRGHSGSAPSTPRSRRTPAANRDPCGNASVSSSTSSSCRGSDCSPTKRQHQRYTTCTDNHGIRPPLPEQYLTPLQQKEVCIRHLRTRLKDTVDTLQDRDTEIDELRSQLCRMQEEWVEEECHRVEAQLALKEARLEIQQLKLAVESVRARLSDVGGSELDLDVQDCFRDINAQNHKLENFLVHMELAQARLARDREAAPRRRTCAGGSAPASVSGESPGGVPRATAAGTLSCSGGNSPARSLTRSSTYTKLSEPTLPQRGGGSNGARDSGFVCSGESIPSRAELLLEAAFLSEETASLLSSYTQTLSQTLPQSQTLSQTPPLSPPLSQATPLSLPPTLAPLLPHTLCPSLPQRFSCACEQTASGEQPGPFLCALAGTGAPCLSHHHHHHLLHHLCVHPLRETGIQTESSGAATAGGCSHDLDTIAEQRTFRSQACSPASTRASDEEEEELDSVTLLSAVPAESPLGGAKEGPEEETDAENPEGRRRGPPEAAEVSDDEPPATPTGDSESMFWAEAGESVDGGPEDAGPAEAAEPDWAASLERAHTSQPRRSASPEAMVPVVHQNGQECGDPAGSGATAPGEAPGCDQIQRSYWSRHFWVDLLAVAIPVVPTVAWLCRGPARGAQPIYHFGSLLRGCCTVALHSLRRGGGLRHYPAGGGGLGGSAM